MSNQPTPEQIAKLPAWAREHIKNLQNQRDRAVRALDEYVNTTTPSPFYTDDMECTGEKSGPTTRRRYIQATTIRIQAARSTCCWLSFVMLMAFLVWLMVAGWMFHRFGAF